MSSISGLSGMSGMGAQAPMMNTNQAIAKADAMIAAFSQGGVGGVTSMMKQQALAGVGLGALGGAGGVSGGLAGGAFGNPMAGLGGSAGFGAGFGAGLNGAAGMGTPVSGVAAPTTAKPASSVAKKEKSDSDDSLKKLLPLIIKLLQDKGGKKTSGKNNSKLSGLLNKLGKK